MKMASTLLLVVLLIITAIGVYWVVAAEQYLTWSMALNRKIHARLDKMLPRPFFIPRAEKNYFRLQAHDGMKYLVGAIHVIGGTLALGTILVLFVVGIA